MTEENTHKLDHHQSRIDRLEGVVEGLATNQAKTETQLSSLLSSVDRISNSFDTFSQQAHTNDRTNWSVLLSSGSLIVTLIIALGAGFVGMPLANLSSEVGVLSERNRDSHNDFRMEIRTIREDMGTHSANDAAVHININEDIKEFKGYVNEFRANQMEDAKDHTSVKERLQNIERDIYTNTKYRNGRPDGSTK